MVAVLCCPNLGKADKPVEAPVAEGSPKSEKPKRKDDQTPPGVKAEQEKTTKPSDKPVVLEPEATASKGKDAEPKVNKPAKDAQRDAKRNVRGVHRHTSGAG